MQTSTSIHNAHTQRAHCISVSLHPSTDATNKPWEFFYGGVLRVPQGSETVRCGYSTQRIPVKDTGSITHSAIICSYLKLGGEGGYLRDCSYTCRGGCVISESDGCAERLSAKGDASQARREREWQRALYVSPVIPAFLWPNIFPLVRAG